MDLNVATSERRYEVGLYPAVLGLFEVSLMFSWRFPIAESALIWSSQPQA